MKNIEKHALANAVSHSGKANPKAVINKVIGGLKGRKTDMRKLAQEVNNIVNSVNRLTIGQQRVKLKKLSPEYFEPKAAPKPKGLPELRGAVRHKVVLRFEPSPSGPLHIGHAYPLLINYLYKKKYDGKLILRLADTNPANIHKPAYKQIMENASWLTDHGIDELHVQSDRMKIYYKYARELVDNNFAYVCTCKAETFRAHIKEKEACPCRRMTPKENVVRWKDMLVRYLPGEAVLRIKTDMKHKNPAIRDWVAFRINEINHPRQKTNYRVWPLMNFAVAIDDHEMKLTHVIHGKDHQDNAEKQSYLFRYFRWKEPEHVYLGRINFKNLRLSTTEFKQHINSKVYTGWDDVRLPTIYALKRRGLQPGAFQKYVKEMGPTKTDKTVSYDDYMKTLYTFNREIIDQVTDRYYFVPEPVKLKVSGSPAVKSVRVKLHPERDDHARDVLVSNRISIPKSDFDKNKGKEIRLKGLYNVTLGKRKVLGSVPTKFSGEAVKASSPKVQWVAGRGIQTEILLPDGKRIDGISELAVTGRDIGDIIQFERFGFVRLDKKQRSKLTFVWTHN